MIEQTHKIDFESDFESLFDLNCIGGSFLKASNFKFGELWIRKICLADSSMGQFKWILKSDFQILHWAVFIKHDS